MPMPASLLAALVASAALAAGAPGQVPAEAPAEAPAGPVVAKAEGRPARGPAEELYSRKCASCHTVGQGVRVGPDLKDVHKRRSRAWLLTMVRTPSTLLDSDPAARDLLTEFKGVRMPDLGLTEAEAATLVDLMIRCSAEPCDLTGAITPAASATPRDVERGRRLFLGLDPLKSGAAPCVACHTVRGAGSAVPGGLLSRDLTHAFARIGDEGLDAALASPAYPLMNKVFAARPLDGAEVFALRAFLRTANQATAPGGDGHLSAGLFGVLGTIAALVALNAAWSRRLRGVRRPLVERKEGSA